MSASATYLHRPPARLGAPTSTRDAWPWILLGGAVLVGGLVAAFASAKVAFVALAALCAPLLVLAPQHALLLFIAALPFDAVASVSEAGELSVTRLLGLAVLGGWLVHVLGQRRPIRLAAAGKLIGAYVAFAVVSVAWAADPSETISSLRTLVQLLLLYVMVSNALRSPADVMRALDVLLVSTTVLAVLVLVQMPATGARATFTFGENTVNPNYLAATLVFPAVAALALGAGRGLFAWWRWALVVPIAVALFSTGSRGGGVAFVVGVAVIAVLRPRLGLGLAGATLAGALLLPVVLPTSAVDRIWQRYANAEQDRLSGRLDIWRVGLAMVRDRPLQGTAFGGFRDAFYEYMIETPVDPRFARMHNRGDRVAHNVYLSTLAELGVIGAALLVMGLAAHGVAVWRLRQRALATRDRQLRRITLALAAVFGSLVVFGGTIDLMMTKVPWMLLAMMHALALQEGRRPAA